MTKPGPVIPERYRQALGDSDPLELQRGAPSRLRRLVAGLSEDQLSTHPAPGKWSIKEVVAHLADGEVINGYTSGYNPGRAGFFLIPAEAENNNERIFVVNKAVKQLDWV